MSAVINSSPDLCRKFGRPADYTEDVHEIVVKYVNDFDAKIKYLKLNLTDDELTIFRYGIEERETDKELMDRIRKSYKTYLIIKKSCYIKIALRFSLVKNMDKAIFKAISIMD